MGRVSKGKGLGKDFHTLAKPLPLAGVKGIYKDKKICQKSHIFVQNT